MLIFVSTSLLVTGVEFGKSGIPVSFSLVAAVAEAVDAAARTATVSSG